jgi:hypothetical protein
MTASKYIPKVLVRLSARVAVAVEEAYRDLLELGRRPN